MVQTVQVVLKSATLFIVIRHEKSNPFVHVRTKGLIFKKSIRL